MGSRPSSLKIVGATGVVSAKVVRLRPRRCGFDTSRITLVSKAAVLRLLLQAGGITYLHDFRRTAVRKLERDGVSRSAAMAMVGHKTEAIYRRYAIVDAGALRDAAAKAAKIDRAAGTKPGTVEADAPPGAAHTA